jgi:hypothetical protein
MHSLREEIVNPMQAILLAVKRLPTFEHDDTQPLPPQAFNAETKETQCLTRRRVLGKKTGEKTYVFDNVNAAHLFAVHLNIPGECLNEIETICIDGQDVTDVPSLNVSLPFTKRPPRFQETNCLPVCNYRDHVAAHWAVNVDSVTITVAEPVADAHAVYLDCFELNAVIRQFGVVYWQYRCCQ